MQIQIPFNFTPRPYQLPLLRAMDNGIKRAVLIAHRRSGKDKTLINLTVKKMLERVGTYFYFFPTYAQGKKILWDGMDKTGFKFLDHIPVAIRKRTNNTDMLIELFNGSIFQIVGTDNIDSIVGTNTIGCVFSEYALQNPAAWDFMRPILRENGGWAVFNYTPRGNNHGKKLYDMARNNPDWFCSLLTINDTKDIDGNRIITDADIEKERRSGMSEELIQQEYYCSFEAAIEGAYYAKEITNMRNSGRICNVPYDSSMPVFSVWDLGINDTMAIGFFQRTTTELRMIDFYENKNYGLDHYVKVLKDKPYVYSKHFAPHDIKVRELSDGKSRLEKAEALGIKFEVVPSLSIEDGIEAARSALTKTYIDQNNCSRFLDCIVEYKKKWDEKNRVFGNKPLHDWTSNAADMFRYASIVIDQMKNDNSEKIEYKENYKRNLNFTNLHF